MPKTVTTQITCDACGKRIDGDYMTVVIDAHDFYVCLPRTAPIYPCGNQTKRKLLSIFSKSDVASMMIEALNEAD